MDMARSHRDGCDVVATGHLESAAKLRRASVLDVGDGEIRVERPSAGFCVECGAGSFRLFRTTSVRARSLDQCDATARRLVPSRLIAGRGHGHQLVAGPVSFSWRMAVAVHIPDHRHGPVFPGTAGAESGPG